MPPSTATKLASGKSKSKLITLHLPPSLLDRFPSDKSSEATSKSSPSADLSTKEVTPSSVEEEAKAAGSSESNGTPAPTNGDANAANGEDDAAQAARSKGMPGPKPGSKRSSAALDGAPKPRGRPGPKKKPRIGELINGEIYKGPTPTTHGPKLGPKANQGAINAGLRALDRTGKPCRKWERKGFSVKSFTGVVWEAPTWRAPKKAVNLDANGEVQSDASSEVKGEGEAQMASVVQSENGTSGSNAETPGMVGGFTSSPAPVAAA